MSIQMAAISLEETMMFYQIFLHYYRGDLFPLTAADWKKLVLMIRDPFDIVLSDRGKEALNKLEELEDETVERFEYDFNRLFVGPKQLLASPYESSYRNEEGVVLQQDTLKVRNFYHVAGLQLAEEGKYPDDHIQFELEFICYLLSKSDSQEMKSLYSLFLEKHLLAWYSKHCKQIEFNSQNTITLAMAYLLRDFLQHEEKLMEGERYLC